MKTHSCVDVRRYGATTSPDQKLHKVRHAAQNHTRLVAPFDMAAKTDKMENLCPVVGFMVAGAWWNIEVTNYYNVPDGHLCHFVVAQYNIHGTYLLGAKQLASSTSTLKECSKGLFSFHPYFYLGSVGYYAFFKEASGIYCPADQTAYVHVTGLGTYDTNRLSLAHDTGDTTYRRSFWYGVVGAIWIAYRSILMRRSYISCKRYGRRCDTMQEKLRFKAAVVYVQESLRLSAHGARNYHRVTLLYLLVEGLMSDLFMLIAQDGFLAKVQYISLGYNLAGVLSMLFEMVESMNWLGEKARCFIKRLLFNYETALIGEFFCAAAMQYYLTSLNRSSLQRTKSSAEAVSYYAWSLVGHGVIVLGIVAAILLIRAAGAIIAIGWNFGSLKLFTAPCSVDTALGVRSKMVLLGGYVWEDGKLHYKAETLKSFGMKQMAEDGTGFLLLHKLQWLSIPQHEMVAIGEVRGHGVQPLIASIIGKSQGGSLTNKPQYLQDNPPVSAILVLPSQAASIQRPGASAEFSAVVREAPSSTITSTQFSTENPQKITSTALTLPTPRAAAAPPTSRQQPVTDTSVTPISAFQAAVLGGSGLSRANFRSNSVGALGLNSFLAADSLPAPFSSSASAFCCLAMP
ncbi:unnamed protein product [Phytophthora lilii]|uniref:Unnamed protein product n=1 Tax=Phytophthora lilii TaxID=2077276 RepID=A0A9W6TNW2_9STRA|nr:unnamed protein product [Phytophthora lilii]